MRSVSSLGLALSLVLGFIFLALIAELYYLLWWKKRTLNSVRDVKEDINSNVSPRRSGDQLKYISSCWTKLPFLGSRVCSSAIMTDTQVYEPQSLSHSNQNKNIWFRQVGEEEDDDDDDCSTTTLSNPPRLLFTIVEESIEGLESEDGGGGGGGGGITNGSLSRRLSDHLALTIETTTPPPYLTPLASPTAFFTPPLTPTFLNGFNPLFEMNQMNKLDL